MPLAPGTRLAAFEILGPLGSGGMGEVYRARDTRLGREVAIKVIAERLVDDPAARARFEGEAQAIASLSHPNILALHDFAREGSVTFAVMELLEGETLSARLAAETFTWRRAVEIAAAIADGLASAHAKGIVHRDLKPANVFITRDGLVKILDFGLASTSPTASGAPVAAGDAADETAPAAAFGTPGYVSPEQAASQAVDHRSDVFSLGCILYEMLTDRPAFRRDTPQESLVAVLRKQPLDFSVSERKIPSRVEAIVRRCLEKHPEHRFQSARDLAFALREALNDRSETSTITVPDRRFPYRAVLLPAALLITVAIVTWLWTGSLGRAPALGSESAIRSLAVLPLVNLSGDPGQEYFADAMTEELTTRLARIGNWRVTSRTSVMGYRGTRKKIPDIARELGVDAIIEGSVQRDGTRVKITAQLIDARNDRHLWANTYEREIESVLGIQDEVARAIATEVDVKLSPEAHAGVSPNTRRVVPAAYDAYVRGRHAWEKRGEQDLHQAIRFFDASIDADPTYAPAYAGLADCYGQLGYGSYISPDDAFPRARAAAQKAIEIDPVLPEAHASLGYALMYYDWNFPAAEAEYKRAIALNPNYAVAHQWYAYLLTAMERPIEEASGEIATARKLDPLSVPINLDEAFVLYYYGRTDEALHAVGLALDMNPKFALGYFWLGRIYASQGRYAEAEQALERIGPLRTWTPAMAALGFLYAKSGRHQQASGVLKEFEELASNGKYASGYAIAVIYAGLGDRERAFAALGAAYRERSHWLVWLKRDPRFADLRSDPRFRDLAKKVGLPS